MNVETTPYVAKKPKVNLGNFFSIKKVLDEELVEVEHLSYVDSELVRLFVCMQFICVNGYSEFHLFTDIRNFVIVLAILCGCLAQFYFKFPDNYWGIFGCIAGYGLFSGIAQCVEWFGMNGNTHIFALDTTVKGNEKINSKHQKFSIALKSELKTYSKDWELTFTSRISSKCQYRTTVDIRPIFDVNGEFVKRNFDKTMTKEWVEVLKRFNSKSD